MSTEPRFGEGSLAVIFQGQNVAHEGMGRDLYLRYQVVRDLFRTASGIVGRDMRDVCFAQTHDWTNLQNRPRYVQPAIVLTEISEYLALQEETDGKYKPVLMTGLSLGLYAALAASGATDPEVAINIAAERGRIVEENAEDNPGGMLTVKDLADTKIKELFEQHPSLVHGVKWGTNRILTVSGARAGIQYVHDWALTHGATVELSKVQEAAHSLLQLNTQPQLEDVLKSSAIKAPIVDLLSNDPLEGTAYLTSKKLIIRHLLDQMVETAEWGEVIDKMLAGGIDEIIEVGPGIDKSEFALARGILRRSRIEAREQRQAIGRGAIKIIKHKELFSA